jgi:hypothetical protein
MQEKLACRCRKSRASDAGKTGLLMQKNWLADAGKAEMLPRLQMSAAEGGGNQVR